MGIILDLIESDNSHRPPINKQNLLIADVLARDKSVYTKEIMVKQAYVDVLSTAAESSVHGYSFTSQYSLVTEDRIS